MRYAEIIDNTVVNVVIADSALEDNWILIPDKYSYIGPGDIYHPGTGIFTVSDKPMTGERMRQMLIDRHAASRK